MNQGILQLHPLACHMFSTFYLKTRLNYMIHTTQQQDMQGLIVL